MSDTADLAAAAHAFNKILSQPKLSSKTRTSDDVEESVKKLRRLILIEGIPSKAVCTPTFRPWRLLLTIFVGSHAATQDLENLVESQRPTRRNIP